MEDTTLNHLMCHNCKMEYSERQITVKGETLRFYIPNCNCRPDNFEKDRRRLQVRELLHDSGIPRRYWNDDLSDWQSTDATARKIGKIEILDFCASYIAKRNNKSMIITGVRGTGKTRLQFWTAIQLIKNELLYVYYITASEMYAAFRENEQRQSMIDTCIACDVLLLDDLGESPIEEWNKKYLYIIINKRYEMNRPVLMNSMRKMSELISDKYVGEHIISRLIEMAGKWYAEIESKEDMRRKL